ncbi:MAG: aminotransferase class I/II-fold pyridoxal phosphate-dependent enzyme [Sphingomonadaceae bacterium]|uniref:serine palmitoyltransferase n=1 Tax=Thermaurantiacus sp. TaxID=2820283 RepID=UPI00298F15D8|nr:aminotransferase class I/II-fold pyridoxal phosphate-dependent enzyme [Thermaurantiacus sp.]MCS6986733.1 aminotransferase class I/II-fold pyridoxal phosphate-dependent enzyme [Sphingomonadaceae bacterium]MDW8414004.1 aminotransferase class I/II-fold pyridoxal phosphate-dependent enzyme [Thermaurantiacus sp.]
MIDLLAKFEPIRREYEFLQSSGLSDPFGVVMERVLSPTRAIIRGRETILVGTYNYMGMTFDPDVIAAGERALREFGAGSTGSRVLNGTFATHVAVEQALKDFYGTRSAIVFSTGYQANLGLVSTLAGKDDVILLDADSHASIWDGCRLGNAQVVRFRHNDAADLEKRLKRVAPGQGRLVVLEGVYSMLGDVAPLADLVAVAKAHGAMVLVDEAHAMGFFGPRGRGVYEEQGLEDKVDFVVGTFSKSVGTVGGFAVSNHPHFEILRLVCNPYRFTASLPPAVAACAEASIRKLMHAHDKRQRLWAVSRRLHANLKAAGFRLATDRAESAIIAVLMPSQEAAVVLWSALLDHGIYCNLARPPATPMGVYLLRCSLSSEHSLDDADEIARRFIAAREACAALAA